MSRSLTTWIAQRYFLSKKRTGLISFTSWVSIIGIALGSFALIVTLSVLNGFEAEITRRTLEVDSHLCLESKNFTREDQRVLQALLDKHQVAEIYPFVKKKAILSSSSLEAMVRIKAFDESILKRMIPMSTAIFRGGNTFQSFVNDLPGIVLGYRLADNLGVYPGDTLYVINPLQIGSGLNLPAVGRFAVTGIFKLDLFDYDDNYAFIDLKEGQRIFDLGNSVSGFDIRLSDYRNAELVKADLSANLDSSVSVNTWADMHRSLYGAMQLEKYGSFVALSFIILVAIFNLASSLVMLIMEKIREVGILQVLGMDNRRLQQIFFKLGYLTGLIGLLLGTGLALILCRLQQVYHFIPLPSVYFVPYLPVIIQPFDVIGVLVAGLILIYGGTVYPIWKVGQLLPLETIQYEK